MKCLEIYRAETLTLVLVTLACQPASKDTNSVTAAGEDTDSGTAAGEVSTGDVDPSGGTTMSETTNPTASESSSGDTSSAEGESSRTESSGGTADPTSGTGGPEVPMCDVWMQDCPEDQKCMPVDMDLNGFNDANHCVPLDANPKEVGEVCLQADGGLVDNCRKGAQCMTNISMGESVDGLCVALCGGTSSAPTCEDGKTCAIWQQGIEPWCMEKCDILTQDCTTPGWMCSYATADSAGCVVDHSGPNGVKNDPCACDPGCCDPGLICILGDVLAACDSSACCTEYCDVTAPMCSGAGVGEECVPSGDIIGPVPGLEDVGVCIIPA